MKNKNKNRILIISFAIMFIILIVAIINMGIDIKTNEGNITNQLIVTNLDEYNTNESDTTSPSSSKQALLEKGVSEETVNSFSDDDLMKYNYDYYSPEYLTWSRAEKYESQNENAKEFPKEKVDEVINRWVILLYEGKDDKQILTKNNTITYNGVVCDDSDGYQSCILNKDASYSGYKQIIIKFNIMVEICNSNIFNTCKIIIF